MLIILGFLKYSTLGKISILHIGTQGLNLQETSILIIKGKQKYKFKQRFKSPYNFAMSGKTESQAVELVHTNIGKGARGGLYRKHGDAR